MQLAEPLREPSPTGGARVLVVDDDEAVLRVFGMQLMRAGYDVDMSHDSLVALERLCSETYDLVICDVEMPSMTGTELLTRLRDAKIDVPVVLVTGNPQLHSAMKAVELGVVRYLTKPVDARTFVQVAGEAVRVHGVARAEQLARDNEALRALVDALHRSNLAAEDASRAKTLFLHTMSDELRTPLVGVLGLTELVLDGDLSADQRENLQSVHESASELLGMIQNVIDIANLTQQKLHLDVRAFQPKDVISAVVRKLEPVARAKGIALSLAVDWEGPDVVNGEAARFAQIVHNLVDNAIKFTKRGDVGVCTEARSDRTGGVLVNVTVTDTGTGIAREVLPTIFEPFVQGDGSLSRAHKGSGLGLAIASQLATLMGGAVDVVATEPGVGSTLRLVVPFAA